LSIPTPRNGRASFQVCVQNCSSRALKVQCSISDAKELKTQVRVVGLVPMPHLTPSTDPGEIEGAEYLPGLVPDPLYPQSDILIGPLETRSFWITLRTPAEASPGSRDVVVQLSLADGKHKVELPARLEISSLIVQPRHDFSVIHWWRGEA